MQASVTKGYRLAAWRRSLEAVARVQKGATPMMQTSLLTQTGSARQPAARPARSSRNNLAAVLIGAGVLLLPVAMFLPWYRDTGGGTLPAWGGYWFVIAGMLALFLAGTWLAVGTLAGRPARGPAWG